MDVIAQYLTRSFMALYAIKLNWKLQRCTYDILSPQLDYLFPRYSSGDDVAPESRIARYSLFLINFMSVEGGRWTGFPLRFRAKKKHLLTGYSKEDFLSDKSKCVPVSHAAGLWTVWRDVKIEKALYKLVNIAISALNVYEVSGSGRSLAKKATNTCLLRSAWQVIIVTQSFVKLSIC